MKGHALTGPAAEHWFAKRIGAFGEVHAGLTDGTTRRERLRAAIRARGIAHAICGKSPAGKIETFADTFERLFSEPPPRNRPRRSGVH